MDLSTLNAEQRQAVEHIDGPLCVVAGAGSGKTRVLTHRIAYLIEQGVPPRNILAVTFTKKAAGEMQERLAALVGHAALEDLTVGTFHSVCYRILREEWRASGHGQRFLEPVQDAWAKRTVKSILAPPGKANPYGMNWDLDVSQALSFIGWQKNNLITPDSPHLDNVPAALEERYRQLYRLYEQIKDREGKLDFDDMLLMTHQLLRDNESARRRYQNLFRYILVDEFQDTNLAQYEILKLLAPPENNIFVVGDARQAIYGWRAARVEFILKFERTWPGAKVVVLRTNYRSTENIVEMSNKLIRGGAVDYPGECKAARGARVEPFVLHFDDEDAEAQAIAEEIKTLVAGGDYRYGDLAALYRVNAQSRALEDALIKAQIPYVIHGAIGFYGRKEVKDVLAYLRILEDPNDVDAIKRVINVPTRYLGKAFVQAAEEYSRRQGIPLLEAVRSCPEAGQWRYRQAREFLWCIDQLRRLVGQGIGLYELVMQARKLTGYDAWLAEEDGADEGADNPRHENLDALAAAAAKFGRLQDFLFYADQAASKPVDPEAGADKVQLMTLHRSKGLEFPVVFLAGLSQGLLPHRRSCVYVDGELVPESVEEERRLCYVGMTRARERLYLSSISEYMAKPTEPSMFLREVLPEVLAEGVENAATGDAA